MSHKALIKIRKHDLIQVVIEFDNYFEKILVGALIWKKLLLVSLLVFSMNTVFAGPAVMHRVSYKLDWKNLIKGGGSMIITPLFSTYA